jgi:hypothetical protein
MWWLDAAVVVGVLLTATKVADLLLRPHQQRRLQSLFETATLSLSYTSAMAASRRLARARFWWLVLVLAIIVPFQMMVALPVLGDMLRRAPQMTNELAGLVVVMVFSATLVSTIPAAFVLRWIMRYESGTKTAIRFGAVSILLIAANVAAAAAVAADVRFEHRLVTQGVGALMLLTGAVTAAIHIAALLFAAVLLAHLVLRLVEALAWRVVEYQRGAMAAVVAIVTALLGVVDIYLKNQ